MPTVANIILVAAVTLTALQAGLFYAWSCSVMLGLAQLSDREFVSVMQKMNRAIQNPVFFASFFGAPVSLIISTVFHYGQTNRFWFLLAATVTFLIGTFGVTVFGNVPLNNRLDRFDLESATDEEVGLRRANFERRWNALNAIRPVSSTIAPVLVVIGCLNSAKH